MSTVPPCSTQGSQGIGYANLTDGTTRDDFLALTTAPASSSFRGSIAIGNQFTPTSAWRQSITLASGPGPVFTDEVVIVEQIGAVGTGALTTRVIPGSTVMPGVGRPFDWTRDRIHFHSEFHFTRGSDPQTTFQMGFCTDAIAATDCCAETLAKLDQIIGYVSKVFPPGGLP